MASTSRATDPIIATTTTNASGQYLFTGLPLDDGDGDADYFVWVNDTASIFDWPDSQTYDADGLAHAQSQCGGAQCRRRPIYATRTSAITPVGQSSSLGADRRHNLA